VNTDLTEGFANTENTEGFANTENTETSARTAISEQPDLKTILRDFASSRLRVRVPASSHPRAFACVFPRIRILAPSRACSRVFASSRLRVRNILRDFASSRWLAWCFAEGIRTFLSEYLPGRSGGGKHGSLVENTRNGRQQHVHGQMRHA
jgi:hypothetical protein